MLAPKRPQQQRLARAKLVGYRSKVLRFDQRSGGESWQIDHPSRSHAIFQWQQVDRLFPGCEMRRRIHMGPGMRIQMQSPRVPAITFHRLRDLKTDSPHAIAKCQGQVDHPYGCIKNRRHRYTSRHSRIALVMSVVRKSPPRSTVRCWGLAKARSTAAYRVIAAVCVSG